MVQRTRRGGLSAPPGLERCASPTTASATAESDRQCHATCPAHRVQVSVGVEKPNAPLRLLKRLDQSVEQYPVEAAIVKANAVLVVLIEGVHGRPRRGELGRVADISGSCAPVQEPKGYQGQSP